MLSLGRPRHHLALTFSPQIGRRRWADSRRLYVYELESGKSQPISPERIHGTAFAISPDSQWVAAIGPDQRGYLYSVAGGSNSNHTDRQYWAVDSITAELVQSGAEGAPAQLLYPGFPKERLSAWHAQEPFSFVENRFLTVRVSYSEADSIAFRKAFACYKSQFRSDEMESYSKQLEDVWAGHIYLRPWFGSEKSEDLFK